MNFCMMINLNRVKCCLISTLKPIYMYSLMTSLPPYMITDGSLAKLKKLTILTIKFLSISWLPVVKQAILNGQLKEMKSGSVMIKSYVKLIHQLSMVHVNPKECISYPMTLWIKLKLYLKENDSTFSIGVHHSSLLLLPVLVLLRSGSQLKFVTYVMLS